jgi:hypothetical protein
MDVILRHFKPFHIFVPLKCILILSSIQLVGLQRGLILEAFPPSSAEVKE